MTNKMTKEKFTKGIIKSALLLYIFMTFLFGGFIYINSNAHNLNYTFLEVISYTGAMLLVIGVTLFLPLFIINYYFLKD